MGTGVRIGTVWDSTAAVLAGRTAPLARLAGLAIFLPSVGQSAVGLYGGASAGAAGFGFVLGLVGFVVTLWAQLAILAIASDPATTGPDAQRLAAHRLLPQIGVLVVLIALAVLLIVPIAIALAASGFDLVAAGAAMQANNPAAMPAMPPAAGVFIVLYSLVLFAAGLWLGARLFLVNAVVLNERRGVGSIARSIELTRGLTWQLIGVALLFGIVLLVTAAAVQSVVGIVFRLLLGPAQITTALFIASIAVAVVTAVFTVVVQVFAARLYATVRGAREGMAATQGLPPAA